MTRPLVVLLLLGACGITETGNPEFDASLTFRASSSAPQRIDIAAPAGTLSVDAAWLAVERVRFVRGAACDGPGGAEIEIPGFVTDTASLVPDVLDASLPADDYCRIRVRLDEATDIGDAPPELAGHSVLVVGQRADGVPYQIRSEESVDAEVRAATPISLRDASAALVVGLDVAVWLNGVNLDEVTPDSDGIIRIEEDSNEDLLDVFEDNLEDALELEDDDDDDDDDDD